MTVGLILKSKTGPVISVEPTASVLEIAETITSHRIGAVLVLHDDGTVAGIVSERDVVKVLANNGGNVAHLTAEDLMSRNVITATPSTSVDDAMEDGKLIGIISIRDLVKYRIMLHEHEVESMKAYVARLV
jgi:CBS domain-containing protein